MTRLAISVVLLCVPLLMAPNVIQGTGAPAGWTTISDNFNRADSTNLGSDWNEANGDWEIESNQVDNNVSGAQSGSVIWVTDQVNARHYGCIVNVTGGNTHGGIKLRVQETADTSDSYVVRWQSTNFVQARHCNGTSCSTFGGNQSHTIHSGDDLCAEVRYTGVDTEFLLWDSPTDTTDRDSWGDADYCWCDSATCAHSDCNCAGSTTCVDGEPGSGNYSDCGSGCYLGFYTGSGTTLAMDDFEAGWQ